MKAWVGHSREWNVRAGRVLLTIWVVREVVTGIRMPLSATLRVGTKDYRLDPYPAARMARLRVKMRAMPAKARRFYNRYIWPVLHPYRLYQYNVRLTDALAETRLAMRQMKMGKN